MVNSTPTIGIFKKEIVEIEEEPTMSKLINKLISDAIEIDETSSQWINNLETFFSLPENITRWQEILSAYASATSELDNLKNILPNSKFGELMGNQENIRNKYFNIQAWIGYFDPNLIQYSEFDNTYNNWVKKRVTSKRLKIIRENMKIIEDDYKGFCDIFIANINKADQRREDLFKEVEVIIEFNRQKHSDFKEKMKDLYKLSERLRSFQFLLMEDLKNAHSDLVEYYNARHIWAQFLMEKMETLKRKEKKKRFSFISLIPHCGNEDRE